MSEETLDTTATTPTSGGQDTTAQATPPAPANEGKLFTEHDVNRIVAERLARERKKTPAPPQPTEPTGESTALLAKLRQMEHLRRFDRAVSGMALSDARRDALETLYLQEQPDDVGAWASTKADLFGWSPQEQKPQQVAQPQLIPTGPAVTAETAPAPDRSGYSEIDNALDWSPEQVQRVIAEKGIKYARKRFEEGLARRNQERR